MITRRLQEKVRETLKRSPSVALIGPRQVGKTTIALNVSETTASVYLDLENRVDLEKVKDIAAFHAANSNQLIILDEVQRLPEVFAPLRSIIDDELRKDKKAGQFLFLGPASINLLKQSSESLAGRISTNELCRFSSRRHWPALRACVLVWLKFSTGSLLGRFAALRLCVR